MIKMQYFCAVPNLGPLTNKEVNAEQDQAVVTRVLSSLRSKDESRQPAKRRDQYQPRRMMRGTNRINNTSALSSSHRRLLDFLLDSPESSKQKQNSFVSLLPPPPSRTASKILPPTSSWDNLSPQRRPFKAQVFKGKSPMNTHEVQVPVLEHQIDEEEWLGIISTTNSDVIKKPNDKEGSSSSVSRPFLGSARLVAPANQSSFTPNTQIVRPTYTGGFNPHKLAPAVHIRSVIPVCAAPPPLQTTPSPPNVSGSPITTTAAAPTPTITTATKSQPAQLLSSELKNKLQL